MNLILFKKHIEKEVLSATDPRTLHILNVLKMKVGDSFDVGVVNGPLGKAKIISEIEGGLELEFKWLENRPSAFLPISLLISYMRPQTMRKILRESTSLGVSSIYIFQSDKSEPSYKQSKLWTTSEWQRQLVMGAEQAFTTIIPDVYHFVNLNCCIEILNKGENKIALDVYESTEKLSEIKLRSEKTLIAIGPESGWSAAERNILRENNFCLAKLGDRVLRSETACIAAVSLIASRIGYL